MPVIPPEIMQAIQALAGGSGGRPTGGGTSNNPPVPDRPVPMPPSVRVSTPSVGTAPLTVVPTTKSTGVLPRADEVLVAKFLQAIRQGKEAVDVFLKRYGAQMNAPTWEALYAAVDRGLPSPSVLGTPGGVPGGAPFAKIATQGSEDAKTQLRAGGFKAGVYVTTEPTTWGGLSDQIIKWLKSDEATSALGDQVPADLDKLIAQKRAEGASASEIANLEAMKSPTGVLAERIATMNPAELLQYNPHLVGMTEIPAGTPIFLGPRTVELGQGETLSDAAKRLNVPLETLVAYQQREYGLSGRTFDADKTSPGQQIYVPPVGFGEQTQPANAPATAPATPSAPPGPNPRGGIGDQQYGPMPAGAGGPQTPPSTTSAPTTGDPYLDMLYNSGGPQAEFASLIGPKKYSGPYGAYLESMMPQAQQILELQKLMNPTGDLRSAGVQLADLIAGLEAGKMPGDPQAVMQAAFNDPRYRAEEAKLAAGGDLISIGGMLGTLRGSGISGTAQSALYHNPDYLGQLLGQYFQLYPAGTTNVPTFFEYLVKGGL